MSLPSVDVTISDAAAVDVSETAGVVDLSVAASDVVVEVLGAVPGQVDAEALEAAVAAYLAANPVEVPTVVHAVGTRTRPSLLGEAADFVTGDSFTADDMPAPVWLTGTSNGKNGLYAKSGSGATRTYTFIEHPEDGTFVWVGADQTEGGDPRLWFLSPQGFAQVYPGVGWLTDLSDFDGDTEPRVGDVVAFGIDGMYGPVTPQVLEAMVRFHAPVSAAGGSIVGDTATVAAFSGVPAGRHIFLENQTVGLDDGFWLSNGDGTFARALSKVALLTYEAGYIGVLVLVGVDVEHDAVATSYRVEQTSPGVLELVRQDYATSADLAALATVATTGDYGDLSNTPTLHPVALSGSYWDLSRPGRQIAQLSSIHDGAVNEDGVSDFLTPEMDGEEQMVVPAGGNAGQPIYRPNAATIGAWPVDYNPFQAVVGLTHQDTAENNGIWRIIISDDSDGLPPEFGVYFIRPLSWDGIYTVGTGPGTYPIVDGEPFKVIHGNHGRTWWEITNVNPGTFECEMRPVLTDAHDVRLGAVDDLTATDLQAALEEIVPQLGGAGVTLSDDVPQSLSVNNAGTSEEASRSDHIHALPTPGDIGAAEDSHDHDGAYVAGGTLATLGTQSTVANATAIGAANGALLLDSDLALPVLAAGDVIEFRAFIAFTNSSGGARNYFPALLLGSTNVVGAQNLTISEATTVLQIEGSISVISTTSQVVAASLGSPTNNAANSIGRVIAQTTEDVSSAKAFNLGIRSNVSTNTQSAQILFFNAWRRRA